MLPLVLVAQRLHRVSLWTDFLDETSGRVLGPGLGFHAGVVVAGVDAEGRFPVERDVCQLHDEFSHLVPHQLAEGFHGDIGIVAGNLENPDDCIRQFRVVRGREYAGTKQFDGFHVSKFINYGHGRQVYYTR